MRNRSVRRFFFFFVARRQAPVVSQFPRTTARPRVNDAFFAFFFHAGSLRQRPNERTRGSRYFCHIFTTYIVLNAGYSAVFEVGGGRRLPLDLIFRARRRQARITDNHPGILGFFFSPKSFIKPLHIFPKQLYKNKTTVSFIRENVKYVYLK